ncbi:hypothetical protein ASPZODRAFT_70363 [Penicilliopsis zonata CBS 506.65]|uniref:Integrase zinc-binding domain-containing protein n=1 Tax=Penicilliopsis zonata CBS 506.65 TaxID=1073090 RepID=A0A1L9SCH7_9EURO|nr:hypothetical protein ASPZODRAFT_70363 [Penicilliopsis zonata CBS 506.65]OJJ44842.1 hypothetical protein ASPZODRAFT_70363 [Penicilliopsis zonata CBS 506.65]
MTSFGRRSTDGHDGYGFTHPIALPGPYSHGDAHEYDTNGVDSFSYAQHSISPYQAPFNGPYNQQSDLRNSQHVSPLYSASQSVPPTPAPDQLRYRHQPSQYMSHSRYIQSPRYLPIREVLDSDIESQESRNEGTMLSEPIIPPLNGFPDVREFDQLMRSYVDDLSIKKQDKALIHSKRARNIRSVLIDPKDTAVESAQFRFWVKKMFKLQAIGIGSSECRKMICHEGKPVAIREKLFKILTKAHQQCQHGGRDKTSAQVRKIYSWVPKELISRFVKICPTCQVRRGASRLTPPNSRRGSPRLELLSRSPRLLSPPSSRRDSAFSGHLSLDRSQTEYYNQVHGQMSWMDSQHTLDGRPIFNAGPTGSLGGGILHTLQNSLSMTLDPYVGADLSSPHINYSSGYVSPHDSSRP